MNTEALAVVKAGATSITETPGNALADQATIGERIDYTVTATIPEGVTVYNGLLVDDYDETRLAYVASSPAAAATLNGSPLPDGWSLTDTGGQISVVYGTPHVNAPDSGDDTLVLTFSVTVLDVAANRRTLSLPNQARQTWDDSRTPAVGHVVDSNNASVRIVEPNLTITKMNDDGDGIVDAGQTVEYQLAVTNDNGPSYVSRAHDLVVTDVLPDEIDCTAVFDITNNGSCVQSNPDTIVWSWAFDAELVALDPAQTVTVGFKAVIPDPIVTSDVFVNQSFVTGSSMAVPATGERDALSPNGGPGSGYQASSENTLSAPRSLLDKSVTPSIQTVGESVRYTVEVLLPAATIQYDTTVIDFLPEGIGVAAAGYSLPATCEEGAAGSGVPCAVPVTAIELPASGDTVGWFLGDLTVTSSVNRVLTIVYDATVDNVSAASDEAALDNSVNVYANRADTIPGIPPTVPDPLLFDVSGDPDEAAVVVSEPELVLTKRVLDGTNRVDNRRALPWEELTYEITLSHTGGTGDHDWPAYDVQITDTITIPSGNTVTPVAIASGSDNGIAYTVVDGNPSDGTLEWFVDGPIMPGDSVTITYTVRVWDADEGDENPAGPEITNTVSNPSYWAVATHVSGDGHREYAGNADIASVELDLASIGDQVWFDVDGNGSPDRVNPRSRTPP